MDGAHSKLRKKIKLQAKKKVSMKLAKSVIPPIPPKTVSDTPSEIAPIAPPIHKDANSIEQSIFDELIEKGPSKKVSKDMDEINYYLSENLDTDIEILNKLPINTNVIACCFSIQTTSTLPYLLYMCVNTRSNVLTFPSYVVKKEYTASQIKGKSENLVKGYLKDAKITYEGALLEGKNVFLFFQFDNDVNNGIEKFILKANKVWFASIHELVNTNKVLQFPINSLISNLFLRNQFLTFLYNSNDVAYDTPSIGYHGTYYRIAPHICSLGLKPSTIYSMLGPYYYFGSFKKSVRYAGWNSEYKERLDQTGKPISNKEGLYTKGAIIRFVTFEGKQKALLNKSTDYYDITSLVRERLTNPKEATYETVINKLHDHNGLWTEKYNSIYVGSVILNNGGKNMSNYEYVVKDSSQQVPLTQHILDKNTLFIDERSKKPKWNPRIETYNIM